MRVGWEVDISVQLLALPHLMHYLRILSDYIMSGIPCIPSIPDLKRILYTCTTILWCLILQLRLSISRSQRLGHICFMDGSSFIVNILLIRCLALALGGQSHGSLPYLERLLMFLNWNYILKEWHIMIDLFLV